MAFTTEFIMGAGGGSGIDLSVYEQIVSLTSGGVTVGEPYVVDKSGVYSVAGFGNLTNNANTMRLELLVNGTVIGIGTAPLEAVSIGCFLTTYLVAGDTLTMRGSYSGIGSPVLYEPIIAVSPVDTVGDGAAHSGGPVEMDRDQWTTLESHTVAQSGVILVDYGVGFATTSGMQSRIAVNGQQRIVNTIRAVNDRWYRMVSVNPGDVVEAQAHTTSFTANGRTVNNWTITFH